MSAPENTATTSADTPREALRVLRGDPTDVQIGVLTALVETARANAQFAATAETGPRNAWGDLESRLREPWNPGPRGFVNARFY